jgi:hypothetical protein
MRNWKEEGEVRGIKLTSNLLGKAQKALLGLRAREGISLV